MSGRINLDNMSEDFKSYIQGLKSDLGIELDSYRIKQVKLLSKFRKKVKKEKMG